MNAPASPGLPRPSRPLLWLALASIPLMAGTLGFVVQYTREWWVMRAGRTPVERRMAMQGPSYFRADYLDGVERLKRVIPEDAKLLIDIGEQRRLMPGNRWMLLLNVDLYPRQVYVRAPELAGATLVEYRDWLDIQRTPLGLREELDLERAMEQAGIDWWLIQPLTQRYIVDELELRRRTPNGWVQVPIPKLEVPLPPNPWKERKERYEQAQFQLEQREMFEQMIEQQRSGE